MEGCQANTDSQYFEPRPWQPLLMAARNADAQNSHVAQPMMPGTAGALLDFYSDPRYQFERE